MSAPFSRDDRDQNPGPVKVVDRRWWARGGDAAAGEPEPRGEKPSYVEELEAQLAEKDRLLQGYVEQMRAASAEFDEARVRARREASRQAERDKRAMLAELLEVMDNLDRAVDAGARAASVESLLEGVRLVRTQFLARLEGFGITPIDALRQPFDPALHEAVSAVPAPRPEDADRVLGVVRAGYRIGDEVLRPAMVSVGRSE